MTDLSARVDAFLDIYAEYRRTYKAWKVLADIEPLPMDKASMAERRTIAGVAEAARAAANNCDAPALVAELREENERLRADALDSERKAVTLCLERDRLGAAIGKHRDAKGHDRCWLNDYALYRTVDPTVADPELPPLTEFLIRCAEYHAEQTGLQNRVGEEPRPSGEGGQDAE